MMVMYYVEKHPTYDKWIPELIFGHLRTGTTYNKMKKKLLAVRMALVSNLYLSGLPTGELKWLPLVV